MTRETRTYTDDERTTAVAVYLEHGLAEAYHRTGIPRSNLRRWAREAGHDPAVLALANRKNMEAAVAASTAYREELREELRTVLLEGALVNAERTKDDGGVKDCAIATGILIDKYRLEMGEATGRSEVAHGDWRKEAAVAADELRKRRQEKAAG